MCSKNGYTKGFLLFNTYYTKITLLYEKIQNCISHSFKADQTRLRTDHGGGPNHPTTKKYQSNPLMRGWQVEEEMGRHGVYARRYAFNINT